MKKSIFLFLTLLFCLICGTTQVQAKELQNEEVKLVNEICKQINLIRSSKGLRMLAVEDDLTDAAMVRAEESSKHWSHERPDGRQWYTVNPEVMMGENLAYTTKIEEIVEMWISSPSHKQNILDTDFRTTGIGIYTKGDTIYVAQEFGF